MTELQPQAADRPALSETRAILFAMLIAPTASFIVNMSARVALGERITTVEQRVAHPAVIDVLSFLAGIWLEPKWMVSHACFIAWLGVVPALMLLRVKGWLNFASALAAGTVLPLSTVSAFALLFWQSTSATTTEKFILYGVLVAMTVPAALAAAVAFWGVYAWAGGRTKGFAQHFFEPLKPRST